MNKPLISIVGYSGFVGSNFIDITNDIFSFDKLKKNNLPFNINPLSSVVINFAGKSHDLKNVISPNEYYSINTELSNKLFDAFLASNAHVFITLSSVKSVADKVSGVLSEDIIPSPVTHYGKSKLLAEKYILSHPIPEGKRVYILRPCMIHGPGNKGNLNLLYSLVSIGLPWPLGLFENKRSFCNITNLIFIIRELIEREDIPSGIYNVADDDSLSTNDVITILAESKNRKPIIWKIPKKLIQFVAKIGNVLKLPLNEERLQKLTDSYVVSNKKIKSAIGKSLPVSCKDGLLKTFKSFN
jgi:nucleoside-diphosphate-sugar epimerase